MGASVPCKEHIQTQLIESARAGIYYRVTYSDNLPTLQTGKTVRPRAVLCNETRSTMEPDERNGKSFSVRRINWEFRLYLEFDREVSIEDWVDQQMREPLKVKDTSDKFIGIAELRGYSVDHPVTNGSSAGSKFVLTFRINSFRK